MFGGPQATFESDTNAQPSCRSSLQNISSIPFLDMSSFQPTQTTNRQSGFESMESMDSELNSGKTTPMNYMRGAGGNGIQRITDPIRNKSHSDSEDGTIGNFLRSSAPAAYDSLDIETFGEQVATYRTESGGDLTPEPWIESSPLTARDSLRQFQPAVQTQVPVQQAAPLVNQFGMEHLNFAHSETSESFYPLDTRQQYNHDEGYYQTQRPQSYPLHGQQHQQQLQGQYQQQPGQGQYGGHSAQGYGQTATTPRIGAVGSATAVSPRRTSHPPSAASASAAAHGQYYQGHQGHLQGQGHFQQHQQQQYAPHHHAQQQAHHQSQHQYNHGSYASAPQTPLSVYRALQNQSQGHGQQFAHQQQLQGQGHGQYAHQQAQGLRSHSHSSEEDQPFGRAASRDYNDGPGVSVPVVGNPRALYPGQSVAPAVRTPKMGYQSQHQHQQHHLHQPQQQGHGHGHGPQTGYPSMAGTGGMLDMQQELVYQVQFKRGCRAFTLSARAGISVAERDFVVVEADRGEDVGIVVEIMSMHAFLERRMNAIRPSAQQQAAAGETEDQNVGCILRLATLHERQQLPDKFHAEKDIVQSCNDLAQHGFGLPITVFEAEFQFDRRKLTIYYDCTVRIDFRDFVRQLYSTYKARIWMKKMSPSAAPEVQPFAAMALATGVQFSGAGSV